jgi:FlaA1/EpsC-like NDP-sugar epimerase
MMNVIRLYFLSLHRTIKIILQVLFDAVMLTAAFVGAYVLGIGSIPSGLAAVSWPTLIASLPTTIAIFYFLGVYRSLVRFTSANFLAMLLAGCGISALLALFISGFLGQSVTWYISTDYFLIFGGLTVGGRFVLRSFFRANLNGEKTPVILYGAGEPGRQLLTALQQGKFHQPVAFLDDLDERLGSIIGGVKVYGLDGLENLILTKKVKVVLIATRRVSRQAQKELAEALKRHAVSVQRIPDVSDLLSGRAKITDFREVGIEELLGRKSVPPVPALLEKNTSGKSVLVTGAGGSIGSEICRQVLNLKPKCLVVFDQSEIALYTIERELTQLLDEENQDIRLVAILGNVCDQQLVEDVTKRFQVQTVFHAAAYKHVPMLEDNILACVENNMIGTQSVVRASIATGVTSFTMVSTDKAVRPTNVMGASKRMAELICQAHAKNQSGTAISIVRFGNVLGSSGSVVPLFRHQIETGGPLTVTHKDITRYFMTVAEASQLVIQSSGMATGGEVFILDMGEPIKIFDLAQSMIRLSGYQTYVSNGSEKENGPTADEIEIVVSGLRPGEKLYEELLIDSDTVPTTHPLIGKAKERMLNLVDLNTALIELQDCIESKNSSGAKEFLRKMPLDYSG